MKTGHTILKKSVALVLVLILGTGVMAGMASASDTAFTETLYTVRILPGAQGSLSGGALVYENMHYGDQIAFSTGSVSIDPESKYYVKGLKDSGMDPNHPTSDFSNSGYLTNSGDTWIITVTKDQDFVVSYGIKGSSIQYTVNYVDENGTQIAPSNIYYGNVGDTAVVSYIYIEGYNPPIETPSMVLSEDPDQNVITFRYETIEQPAETPTEAPTQPAQVEQPTVAQPPVVDQAAQQPAADQNAEQPAADQGTAPVETPAEVPDGLGDGSIPQEYYDETSNSPYGFRVPGVEYTGEPEDLTGTEEGQTTGDDGLIDIGDTAVPLAQGSMDKGTDFVVKNAHLDFEYHYDRPQSSDSMTAFHNHKDLTETEE